MHPALRDAVTPIDAPPWLDLLEREFGVPPSVFDGYLLFRTSKQHIRIVARDHVPTERPAPENIGLRLLRTHMKYPKLTTDAAMIFGPHATRNVVDATAAQAEAYLNREPFAPSPAQTDRCTGTGYVIVRHDGIILGVGLYHAERGVVQSQLPKVRARNVAGMGID